MPSLDLEPGCVEPREREVLKLYETQDHSLVAMLLPTIPISNSSDKYLRFPSPFLLHTLLDLWPVCSCNILVDLINAFVSIQMANDT